MEILRRKWNLIGVLKLFAFILLVNKVQCSRRWYEQPQSRSVPSPFSNRRYPMHPNVDNENDDSSQVIAKSLDDDIRRIFRFPSELRAADTRRSDGKFIFPEYDIESRRMEIGPVPVCEGSTFCEEVPDYPTDLVKSVISKDRSLRNYENVDVADVIAQRIDDADTEPLCIATEKVVFPKSAETMDSQWMFVVNHPNFTQGVRIETCENQGNGCKLIDGFAEGYTTSCEQKYIYRQLTAIVPDGTVSREFFRFPASCCCHVRFTGIMAPRSISPRKGT